MSMIAPVLLPLFAYGTLLDPAFTGHLLERPVTPEPARLLGWELLRLSGLPYPVICEAPGTELEGRIYRQLRHSDFDRLDAYEGVAEGLYRRVTAEAITGDAAEEPEVREPVFVYVPTGDTVRRYA